MFKYFKAFFKGGYKILFSYPKIRRYAKHKERYTLEERYRFARKLIGYAFKAMNVKFDVEGLEKIKKDENYLVVCNHQGFMDALTMIYLYDKPMIFVAKKESLKYPFAGKVIHFIDSICIDRDNIRDAVKMIKECKEKLNNNLNVIIFPEGTRTKDKNYYTGEYKAGALKSAYETKKKMAIVALDGSYKVLSKSYKQKEYYIKVRVIEIIDPSIYDKKNTTDLSKEIEKKTNETLTRVRVETKLLKK